METTSNTKRSNTFFYSVIGVLIALGIYDVLNTFTGVYAPFGLLYPAAHVFLNILLFLSLSFIASKEKWALYLFLGIILMHLGLDVYVKAFNYYKLLLLIPFFYFFKKLN